MFTGIVSALGQIQAVRQLGESLAHGRRLELSCPAGFVDDLAPGDSVALNGACMTVTAVDPARLNFCIDISQESLECTTGLDQSGPVNLEKAIRASDRLGGHLVSGHVDGMGRVERTWPDGRSQRWRFTAPRGLLRYIADKGSICVDGVSLTVNRADGQGFEVNLVPHTIEHTAFASTPVGAAVNLEVDLVARYLERLASGPQA